MNKKDYFSEFQTWRHQYTPEIPEIYKQEGQFSVKKHPVNVEEKIAKLFPTLFAEGPSYAELTKVPITEYSPYSPLRIAVILSGGQAAGGHNVISGLYDFIKNYHSNSQLFGFIGGSKGIYTNEYIEINEQIMDQYRNQGGFDMICSGRNKIETPEQFEKSLMYCSALKLDGLIVVGGDDSNTNACLLAEYFLKNQCSTKVIGVPKTIDGDLKNEWIETSFGFDTATRIYSEMIGNICTDVLSTKKYYNFIKLMGRSASHVAMECCLNTQINWTIIGEEIEEKKKCFKDIVLECSDIICKRANEGKDYGVFLVPEGLIEFVDEFKALIKELNEILAKVNESDTKDSVLKLVLETLTEKPKILFQSLPRAMADQLLLERDPHGNVQLSRIETEKYLISQIEVELEKRRESGNYKGRFLSRHHFFGYEGQSALPSNFDSEYCYKLGYNAGGLISLGMSGYMSIIRGLDQKDPKKWIAAGCPLMTMMNMERRSGKDVCVIRKSLLDMNDARFKYYEKVRETWALNDCYRNPGPIQYSGPLSFSCSYLIKPPDFNKVNLEEFSNKKQLFPPENLPWAPKWPTNMSPFALALAKKEIRLPQIFSKGYKLKRSSIPIKFLSDEVKKECAVDYKNVYENTNSNRLVELVDNIESLKLCVGETLFKPRSNDVRIGIVYSGRQAPGGNNIVNGLLEFKKAHPQLKVTLIGFLGGNLGMFDGKHIIINEANFANYRNQGGFDFLGRSIDKVRSNEELAATLKVCVNLNLDGLILIGATHTMSDALLLSDYFLAKKVKTSVIGIPCTIVKNVCHPSLLEAVVGFATTSKVYSNLIGNIMTDCSSTPKYWYIIKLMGKEPSHLVLECALQTHPNYVVISEEVAHREQSFDDIINNICDVIIKRNNENKNFGTILFPEGILLHLPFFKQLIDEIDIVFSKNGYDERFVKKLMTDEQFLRKHLSPWNVAKFNVLPDFAKFQLLSPRDINGNFEITELETEKLMAYLINEELEKRKKENKYHGVFTAITHSFSYQGRSSFPSMFDATLATVYGFTAASLIYHGLTGYIPTAIGLNGPIETWKLAGLPLISMLDLFAKPQADKNTHIPSTNVQLKSKVFSEFKTERKKWTYEDHYRNPGPIQYFDFDENFTTTTLILQHKQYSQLQNKIDEYINQVKSSCRLGTDESILKAVAHQLKTATKIIALLEDKN